MKQRRQDQCPSGKLSTLNDEQMGSTPLGDAAAGMTRPASPQQTETDRGTDGRVSGRA